MKLWFPLEKRCEDLSTSTMHYKGLAWDTRSTDPHDGSRKTDKLQERSWRAKLEDSAFVSAGRPNIVFTPLPSVASCLCFHLILECRLLKWDRTETSSPNLSPIFLQVSSWGRVLQSTTLMKFISSFFFRNIGFFYQRQWVFILYPNYIMIRWEDDD